MWLTTLAPRMGEPGISVFGNYEHGIRYGAWYKIDHSGDLISIEHFRNNVLDGEVRYYDQGRLYCVGYYRGLNPGKAFDTIVVTHPVTHEEQYKVVSTDQGALRHGNWSYYDPYNGRLIKEEEYQVDELIYKKEYDVSAAADSLLKKKRAEVMPHNTGKGAAAPPGKKYSYTEY